MSVEINPLFSVGYVDTKKPGVFLELMAEDIKERVINEEGLYIIGLTSEEYAAGALVFERIHDYLEIVSLYVLPEFRHKGGSRLLLAALEAIASKLDYIVTARFSMVDGETELLEEAFENADFQKREDVDYKTYIVTLADCEDAESLKKVKKNPKIKYFSELTDNKLKSYNKQAEEKFAPLPIDGLTSETVDRELSAVYEENGRIKGYVVIENISYKNGIRVAAAYNGSDNPLILMWLLKAAISAAENKYDANIPLVIDVVDDNADRFVRYILPEVTEVSRIFDKVPDMV
ncbi:MAG: GNAT family N-acetyltransferase [Lachnospiraceae bacterium]|nr:GNAT family N-acetyltransferase [Lachnospiraceae bacterium]MBQ9609389.1 GNAT family N-acetyltransferase [Lachnospiraceae bacterium]